jgi:ABC-type multidrug transport system fused ATPase/permease subunit
VSYRLGLPPILKGISIVIQPRQKIGVCGRTGAGELQVILLLESYILNIMFFNFSLGKSSLFQV